MLRANPAYELVLLDRLSRSERARVRALAGTDEELYGVLRPRDGSGLDVRSVSPHTALLFLTLSTPGPLPSYASTRLGPDTEPTIRRLVLDGVLQVSDGDGYVSGASAVTLLSPARAFDGLGRTAELSLAALRYGQELTGLPESLLAQRLYAYGRRPMSPALRREFADDSAMTKLLDLCEGGVAQRALGGSWLPLPDTGGTWLHWRRIGSPSRRSAPRFKLYVSPDLGAVTAAVAAVSDELATVRGVAGFKVGRDLWGVCRPDKLVVHCDRFDDLRLVAARLEASLSGCPAHGVPFTAAITPDGLLSWGVDQAGTTPGTGTSWRMWIAERLAEYLVVAGASGAVEPWRYALERIALEGVDVDTWAPTGWTRADAGQERGSRRDDP